MNVKTNVKAGRLRVQAESSARPMRHNVYAGCWLGAIMFCLAATASSQTVSFQAARTYAAGVFPYSVAVADFNGDGRPDLAVADNNGGVSVLLGNGDGTFQPPVNYPAGLSPYSVAVGDFNGDGKPDLAVANSGNNTVSVLLGNGDGTFQAAVNYAVGTNPISVAVGDFNGDGRLDLAVANLIAYGTVSVLLGNGDGTFQPVVSYSAGLSPRSVAVGDFNGDGKPDLVVADTNGGGVSVLLNNGDGTFPTTPAFYAAGSYPYSVAVGDFNNDGKSDLAVANVDGTVSVLFGNGNGTFQPAVNYATGGDPISVAVGDFNGDNKSDLAVTNNSGCSVSVLLNIGGGTFTTVTNFVVGPGYSSVAVGDFNGDGKPDLAVTDSAGGNVSVLLGNGDGTFPAAANYVAGGDPISVAVGDFNNDGKPDLAVTDFTGGVNVLLGNGDGTFQAAVSYPAGSGPSSVAVGDFNHDGNSDLAVADNNDDTVSVLLGNGDGTFQAAVNYPADSTNFLGATSVAVGDFDGDGKPDLAVVNRLLVDVLLGNGDGTFQAPVRYFPVSNPSSVAVGNFNGDGKPDLALATNGGLSVLLNSGSGTFPTAVPYTFGNYSKSVAVGDFNGDGILDLAVTDLGGTVTPDPGRVWVLLGNGDGTFQAAVNYAAGGYPVSVAVGDFNGDGKPDLAVANNSGGKLSVLLNTTRLASSTTLTSSLNPSTPGQSVMFTATVISSGGVPTGNVTFNDGVTALGTGTLSTSGQATLATAALSAGTHAITAVYGGDTNFATSASSPLTQTVKFSTTTTLTSSLNPSTFGQSVTFTAKVSSSGGQPTGNVTFNDGPSVLGTGILDPSGQATLATAALSAGTHTITAVYGGDPNFASSTASGSSALTQTVKFSTTTTLTSSFNPSTLGQSVTFTATVISSGGVPTGNVIFNDGVTALGTGPLSTSGQAIFTTVALTTGPHSITAVYGGDTNFVGSKSAQLAQTVNQAPAITSASSATFMMVTAGSFTVTVTGFPAPTLSETGMLPSGVSFNASTGVLSGTPAAGTGGTYNLTFTATNSAGNATQNFTLMVQDFTISASPASQTTSGGKSAVYAISLTSKGGLTGNVSLSCSGGPPNSTCTISPSSVMLTGTASAKVTLFAPMKVNKGTFTLTFTGTLASLTHSTNVSLTVK